MDADIDRGGKSKKIDSGLSPRRWRRKGKNRGKNRGKIFETNSVDRKGGFDIIIGYRQRRSGVRAINKKER